MANTALVAVRHGYSYDSWLSRAGRPRGGKALHAAWWRGETPESHRARKNPVGGVGAAVVALVAATIGGVVTYFGTKWIASKMAISDPLTISQAQVNLQNVTAQTLSPPTPAVVPYKYQPATIGTVTPDFTASVASFQAYINVNGQAFLQSIQGQSGAPQIASGLTLPLRTDGVLDPATFDWLVIAANG